MNNDLVIKEVKTKKQVKDFINFPLMLYKNNKYFVPFLYGDEKAIFKKNYLYREQADYKAFLAYKDNKVVGRVLAIIQKVSNEKWQQKRVRFSRFDSINDVNVSNALFKKVEEYGKINGMNEIVGPLGFSDMDREGLLIEGFDYLSTFEEQYNYQYYQSLIESFGFEKEIDWEESRIFPNKERNENHRLDRLANIVMKKNHLHFAQAKNTKLFLKKYKDDLFYLCDETYKNLYQTVPFSEKIKKSLIRSFSLILNKKYLGLVLNERNEPVCFGLLFPELGSAVQRSGGRLYPWTLIKLLYKVRHPKIFDLGLIGVHPDYINCGTVAIIIAQMNSYLNNGKTIYMETNLNLENNSNIISLWNNFDHIQHKKRRSFVKKI